MGKQNHRTEEIRLALGSELPPGAMIYTILRHVSRSGMSRWIDAYYHGHGSPICLSPQAARILGCPLSNRWQGVRLNGCGMDIGFELVYCLSRALYPDGFQCVGEKCPSNDHSNGDRDYTPHHHTDGGYALRHQWL